MAGWRSAIDRALAALPACGPWFLEDDGAIRARVRGVVTCPVCAAAGGTGIVWWEYDTALGLTSLEAAELAEAADGRTDGALRGRLLDACLLSAQSLLDL